MILNSRTVSLLSLWERELIVGDLEFARGQSPLPPGEGADLSVILNSRTVSSLSPWERELIVGDLEFAHGQFPLPLGEG